MTPSDVAIKTLGKCEFDSPVADHLGSDALFFVGEADRVLVNDTLSDVSGTPLDQLAAFELAGPRNKIFFDPTQTRCGIVTCGGLCPGLNNVVRGIVLELAYGYGIGEVLGFRYGYQGLIDGLGVEPDILTAKSVSQIHHGGGTILGSSRGEQSPERVVDSLVRRGVDVLFVVGGDGTIRGAMRIVAEIERRNLQISVIGVPKTIDNDIHFIDRSFGFESAVSAAVDVIRGALVEATGARNGIGLVKLMGRDSGFVACQAALASTEADLVLIPEVDWSLRGPKGVFSYVERVLAKKGHAVIVAAEGAGQEMMVPSGETDPSGNPKFEDVGAFLRDELKIHFTRQNMEFTLKYIDPSYSIRSIPASPADSVYCWKLARNAVHAAMAGNTEMLIGRWHGRFVHVPMPLATMETKRVDPRGDLWMSVMEATGQPRSLS
jgi:6-phosphofructokinase 1